MMEDQMFILRKKEINLNSQEIETHWLAPTCMLLNFAETRPITPAFISLRPRSSVKHDYNSIKLLKLPLQIEITAPVYINK